MVEMKLIKTPTGFQEYLVVDGAVADLKDLRELMRSLQQEASIVSPQRRRRTAIIIPLASVEFASSDAA